jgi:hypothetical protein
MRGVQWWRVQGQAEAWSERTWELQHGHAPSFEASPGIIAGINNGLEPSSRDPVPLEVIEMIGKKVRDHQCVGRG